MNRYLTSKILCYGIFAVVVISFFITIFLKIPSSDAYYYIGVSRLINEGLVPFKDFKLTYTPLSFYIMALPIKWFGYSPEMVFCISYILQIVNSFLLFKLLSRFISNIKLVIYCILYYLVSFYILGGTNYMLEPHAAFWGILSLLLITKGTSISILFAGFACSCSFLCKQYGAGYVMLCLIYVMISRTSISQKILNLFLIIFGIICPLLILYFFFKTQGVDLLESSMQMSGTSYASKHFGFPGIVGLLTGYIYLIVLFPTVYLGVYYYIKNFKVLKRNNLITLSVLGILGFMLQFFIRPFSHYMQLTLPLIFLFMGIMGEKYIIPFLKTKRYLYTLCFVTILIPTVICIAACIRMIVIDRKGKTLELAEKIESYVPKNSKNVCLTHKFLILGLTNNYIAPCLKEHGMSNGFSANVFDELLNEAEYCVISQSELNANTETNPLITMYLNENFNMVYNDVDNDCCVFKRK